MLGFYLTFFLRSGVVVEGNLINENKFNAKIVLAKHDETICLQNLIILQNLQLNTMIAEQECFFNLTLIVSSLGLLVPYLNSMKILITQIKAAN